MNQLPRHDESIITNQRLPRGFHTFLAVLCKWEVGDSGVSAVQRPFSFAVADYEAPGWHFAFPFLFRFWLWLLVCVW